MERAGTRAIEITLMKTKMGINTILELALALYEQKLYKQ